MSGLRRRGIGRLHQRRLQASLPLRIALICLVVLAGAVLPPLPASGPDRERLEVQPHPQDQALVCPAGTGEPCDMSRFVAAYGLDSTLDSRLICALARNGGLNAAYDPARPILLRVTQVCDEDGEGCRPRLQGMC